MKGGLLLNRSKQVPAEDSAAFGGIAERFRRAGDLDRAIALCRDGLKKFPAMLSARVTLGWALLDKGEYREARTELEQVLRRAPDNLAAIRGLAELHDRTAHMESDGNPAWHQEQQEALEDLAAAMEAASSELAADELRQALPIIEEERPETLPAQNERHEALPFEPVLISAAEQAMAAVTELRDAIVVPTVTFEVDGPETLANSLALDQSGVFTQLVTDDGAGGAGIEGLLSTDQSAPQALHTQALEFDAADLADIQSLAFDSPQAARTQLLEFDVVPPVHSESLELDPPQPAFTEERREAFPIEQERREAFPIEQERREAFPIEQERREAFPIEQERREAFPFKKDEAPAGAAAAWSTEALDLDLPPVPETIVTLPTNEVVELDALATAFASPIAEEVPDCVLEVSPDEFVSAEETVTDLQAPVFAGEMPAGLGGHLADQMAADGSEDAIEGIANDIAAGLGLSTLPAFDLTPPDAVGDDEEPVDTPIAAFASVTPEMPLMALLDERILVAEPLEAPIAAFAPVIPLAPVEPQKIEELFPIRETDVAPPVEAPVAAFAAVMPAMIDERFPVVETGFVLPAAPVQRHPALVPLERLLRQVQARRLELATASVA